VRSTAAGTDQILWDIRFGTAFDWFNQVTIAVFDISYVKLIIEGCRSVHSRKFINLEFLVLRGMGIIESPLLERNIFADKEK
jgi:hypothetical protein